jgi:ABC-2 type transport system ATP-binding protein
VTQTTRSTHISDTAISVANLTKRFGKVAAVDHISFQVTRGEFFGFLGPNGAGKTTTSRMIAGVIRADEGTASILGHKAGSIGAKQVAGVVPEMSNAYTDISGWANLMLMANLYGIARNKAEARGIGLLQRMGLLERKDTRVQTYSKGMKQRLVLCMSLMGDPEILFLDEPTSGLDVQSTRLMRELLRSLNAEGKTVFMTTHDMEEANQLCHRVAIINKGKIVAIDAPEKLKLAVSAMHSVEVSFEGGVSPQALEQLPGVSSVSKLGDKYRLYTDSPGSVACSVAGLSSNNEAKILSLNTIAPSLEDAFVALTEKGVKNA